MLKDHVLFTQMRVPGIHLLRDQGKDQPPPLQWAINSLAKANVGIVRYPIDATIPLIQYEIQS
jgi:hypothetical protein